MATLDDIKKCLGTAVAAYAERKHRGGRNNQRGTRYEDLFKTYETVRALSAMIRGDMDSDPHIADQILGFVDDLRIATRLSTSYFQLKNVSTLVWQAEGSPNSLATDFCRQKVLSAYLDEPPCTTGLVVPSEGLAASLRESVPDCIRDHTIVVMFPWRETANRMVLEDPELRTWLSDLVIVEGAPLDVLTGALNALLSVSLSYPEGARATEIFHDAQAQFPSIVRPLPASEDWERNLLPQFREVLAEICGLQYGAPRGVFTWAAFNTQGTFDAPVTTSRFVRFQEDVIAKAPKTFEEFEGLLP